MKAKFTARIKEQNPVHTWITVFNHGGNSGTLIVNTEDADELISRICGGVSIQQQADVVTGTMVGAVIGKL